MIPRCNAPFCDAIGIHVHRWRDAETGEVVATWHYCAAHNSPADPDKRVGRFREGDGSLTTLVSIRQRDDISTTPQDAPRTWQCPNCSEPLPYEGMDHVCIDPDDYWVTVKD